MLPSSIRPTVSENTITKVTRLFNGTLTDILNEMIQNARRAGATRVDIDREKTEAGFTLWIGDNGSGVERPESLLTLGSSGWNSEICDAEDPAGMGVFSLAGRRVTIMSRHAEHPHGWRIVIPEDGWTGQVDLDVDRFDHPVGTTISFPVCELAAHEIEKFVANVALHCPIAVTLDGKAMLSRDFLEGACNIVEWQGSRIGVFTGRPPLWDNHLNFHGLTLTSKLPTVSDSLRGTSWWVRVDIGATPDLKLVLPARKEAVENDCLRSLRIACEKAIYRTISEQPSHRLSHEYWTRAGELGVILPEAEAVLDRWEPGYADSANNPYTLTRIEVTPSTILVLGDETYVEQALAHTLANNPVRDRLAATHQNYVGYSWYDKLTQLTDIGFIIRDGDATINLAPDPDTSDKLEQHVAADEITMFYVLMRVDGTTERCEVPADIAFYMDGYWDNLDGLAVAWRRTSSLQPEALVDMMHAVCFSPSDDNDADSWDTQHTYFLREARRTARSILLGGEAAIIGDIEDLIARNRWRLPNNREVTIAINAETVTVALGDLQEAA